MDQEVFVPVHGDESIRFEGGPDRARIDRRKRKMILEPFREGHATQPEQEKGVEPIRQHGTPPAREGDVDEPAGDAAGFPDEVCPAVRGEMLQRILADHEIENAGGEREFLAGCSDRGQIGVGGIAEPGITADERSVPELSQPQTPASDLEDGQIGVAREKSNQGKVPGIAVEHGLSPITGFGTCPSGHLVEKARRRGAGDHTAGPAWLLRSDPAPSPQP